MKAAQINQYGGDEVVTVNPNAPQPELEPGHLLVEVHAAAINPSDWKIRQGMMQSAVKQPFPITLGGDFSGVVTQIGEGVAGYNVGDEVYGQSNVVEKGTGSFAEFTAPDVNYVAHKPKTMSHSEAAGLPLTGVSALEVITEHMQLQAGQSILIHGGAGGIGTIAIQLAKYIGAKIYTTATGEDLEYVKQLGAETVIDYKTQQFETIVKDVDFVFDTVGGETYKKSYQILKPGGLIVSMIERPDRELMQKYNVRAIAQASKVTTKRLTKLSELVDQGAIKVHIDKTFSLDQAADAIEYLEHGHPKGKVVIITK